MTRMNPGDLDRLLYHAMAAGITTKAQAEIARKINAGQALTQSGIPNLMVLDDGTAVVADDLKAFGAELLALLFPKEAQACQD